MGKSKIDVARKLERLIRDGWTVTLQPISEYMQPMIAGKAQRSDTMFCEIQPALQDCVIALVMDIKKHEAVGA